MNNRKSASEKNTRKNRIEVTPTSKLLEKIYLNEHESAALTGKSVFSLRNDRHLRRGLPYLKIGTRSVMYKKQDVIEFMEACPIACGGK